MSSEGTISRGVLRAYRVLAYTTGVLLLVLVFVHLPLRYLAEDERLRWVSFAHGWIYVLYLIVAGIIAYSLRWSARRSLLVLLAGTVPFMSFVAERKVVALAAPHVRDRGGAPDESRRTADLSGGAGRRD